MISRDAKNVSKADPIKDNARSIDIHRSQSNMESTPDEMKSSKGRSRRFRISRGAKNVSKADPIKDNARSTDIHRSQSNMESTPDERKSSKGRSRRLRISRCAKKAEPVKIPALLSKLLLTPSHKPFQSQTPWQKLRYHHPKNSDFSAQELRRLRRAERAFCVSDRMSDNFDSAPQDFKMASILSSLIP